VRFLTDENLPREIVQLLRQLDHDALDVRESGMAGATDRQVSARAQSEARILVTMDLDFANIVQYPPGDFAGILVLRVPHPTRLYAVNTLRNFLSAVDEKDIGRALVIVEPGAYRIRRG
jgi:predicted nuclease of predicted toxin-antitoxin system